MQVGRRKLNASLSKKIDKNKKKFIIFFFSVKSDFKIDASWVVRYGKN